MVFWKSKKTSDASDGASSPNSDAAASKDDSKKSGGWWAGLRKTAQFLNTDIRDLWKSEGELVDDEFLQKLFAVLVKSDMGGEMARTIRDRIGRDYRARKVRFEEMLAVISEEIRNSLQQTGTAVNMAASGPTVILVVGVNGSGKTTSIAKLANRFTKQGKRVLLGAGDTFRAAAVEQLRIWSERIGCDIVTAASGADPATVAFQTTQRAVAENYDVCILDTAGRLQTQSHLMQQLDKIRRVIAKHVADGPHEVLLVLDATAGQNAISQAKGFSETAGCTGIVLAKLDGSAKGGVVIPIRQQFNLPVKLVGLGEQLDDMAEFDPDQFTKALFTDGK
ncbi:MAG: signal recognition particle-docking protein FtsY [Pirellulales bacterium]